LILHSLAQFHNFAGSSAGSKFNRDIWDHSQCSSVVSRREMQVHPHNLLAAVSVSHPHIVKRHTMTSTIRDAVMPERMHSESRQTETSLDRV